MALFFNKVRHAVLKIVEFQSYQMIPGIGGQYPSIRIEPYVLNASYVVVHLKRRAVCAK